ncbi:MAG: histidinol-phosphate transaminase [Anaerolineae bacterium]|nr:histidinol-phosphate transaminase [Anaerolineae bacterium]
MNYVKTIYDSLIYQIIGAGMDVYNELGPGYPERTYREAMIVALRERHVPVQKEMTFIAEYHGQQVGQFYVDLLVDEAIVVEIKAIETIDKSCEEQIISYLTVTGREVGLVLNFGATEFVKRRYFLPYNIQQSATFQTKLNTWKTKWLQKEELSIKELVSPYNLSVKSVEIIRSDIATMEPYTPIFPFEVLAERLGRRPEEIIKLDANENPYGPSPKVKAALANLQYTHIYPDPGSDTLRAALAEFTGVPAEYLLAGAGADELLDVIMRLFLQPGDAILNCPPTFGMYPFDAALHGADVISAPRHADFSLNMEAIEAAVFAHHPKLLFITSPNNPDGNWVSDAELERLLALPAVVVLDEAYVEFAGVNGTPGMARSRIRQVPDRDNLIVLRTFSKLAALAGLRVGYGAFPIALMEHLWKIKQPYNVSVAASTAAIAALDDLEWLTDKVDRIVAERARFFDLLNTISYLQPYPSHSNFILCKVLNRDAHELKLALEKEGILIRYYRKAGLSDHVRFTVGRPDQVDRVIEVLQRL